MQIRAHAVEMNRYLVELIVDKFLTNGWTAVAD